MTSTNDRLDRLEALVLASYGLHANSVHILGNYSQADEATLDLLAELRAEGA